MPQWVQAIYRVMIWGSALKIVLSLLYTVIRLTIASDSEKHILGKMLFGVLGAAVAIAFGIYLRLPEVSEAVLLLPTPTSFFTMGGSALCTYWLLWLLAQIIRHRGNALADGWIVCALSALIAVFIPIALESWGSVPDVTKYVAGALLSGALFGGMYYFAVNLLRPATQ